MDWKDLAGSLVKAGAPVIGTALGGPLGGMIGAGIGQVIANSLGVTATPDAINTAIITGDPAVVQAQLTAAEAEAQAKWPALAQIAQAEADLGKAQVSEIGETMRAELKDGAWYQRLWRPCLMYLWGATWPWQLYAVLYATDVTQRASILYALAAWNAVPSSIAGVYAWGRTKEKITNMIPPLPGPAGVVQRAIKAVRGR